MKILPLRLLFGDCRREAVGERAHHEVRDRLGERLGLVPSRAWRESAATTCSPLPPVVLRKPVERQLVEQRAQETHARSRARCQGSRRRDRSRRSGDRGGRGAGLARSPRMQLDARPTARAPTSAFALLALMYVAVPSPSGTSMRVDRGVDALVGVLLVEALLRPAVGTADEAQRTLLRCAAASTAPSLA